MQRNAILLIKALIMALINGDDRSGFQGTESGLAQVFGQCEDGATVITQDKVLPRVLSRCGLSQPGCGPVESATAP